MISPNYIVLDALILRIMALIDISQKLLELLAIDLTLLLRCLVLLLLQGSTASVFLEFL